MSVKRISNGNNSYHNAQFELWGQIYISYDLSLSSIYPQLRWRPFEILFFIKNLIFWLTNQPNIPKQSHSLISRKHFLLRYLKTFWGHSLSVLWRGKLSCCPSPLQRCPRAPQTRTTEILKSHSFWFFQWPIIRWSYSFLILKREYVQVWLKKTAFKFSLKQIEDKKTCFKTSLVRSFTWIRPSTPVESIL